MSEEKTNESSIVEEAKKKVKIYSHSKLWLYEHCPEAYKIKYIDKKFPELPKSIEAFLGDIVHQSLDWFYTELLKVNIVSLDDFIHQFIQYWKRNFSEELRINSSFNENHYFNKGIKFLVDYYEKNKPFPDNTIATEKEFFFDLDEKGEYKIRGFIDRIVLNKKENEYEVHDYKTNDWLKSQEEIDADGQLAFYHLGINDLFGKQEKVKLVWHFLAHNRKMESRRTQQELKHLKEETFILIKKIESTVSWPACGKKWCDWCEYKRRNGLGNW